jgi:hypothetical protein
MKRIALLLPVLFLLVACSKRDETPLPDAILSMSLTETLTGTEAAEIIDHLHQGTVAPDRNYVGRYRGDGNSATYYLSVYGTVDEAQSELDAMVAGLERGGHVFDHVRVRSVNGKDVWMALGMGQAHYFYAEGDRLIWLAVDVVVAEDAIQSLL